MLGPVGWSLFVSQKDLKRKEVVLRGEDISRTLREDIMSHWIGACEGGEVGLMVDYDNRVPGSESRWMVEKSAKVTAGRTQCDPLLIGPTSLLGGLFMVTDVLSIYRDRDREAGTHRDRLHQASLG